MAAIEHLLTVVDAFRAAKGLSEARVATLMLGSGQSLARLRGGADIGVRRLSEALQWLSDNWPENAAWPDHVERPLPAAPAPEETDAA